MKKNFIKNAMISMIALSLFSACARSKFHVNHKNPNSLSQEQGNDPRSPYKKLSTKSSSPQKEDDLSQVFKLSEVNEDSCNEKLNITLNTDLIELNNSISDIKAITSFLQEDNNSPYKEVLVKIAQNKITVQVIDNNGSIVINSDDSSLDINNANTEITINGTYSLMFSINESKNRILLKVTKNTFVQETAEDSSFISEAWMFELLEITDGLYEITQAMKTEAQGPLKMSSSKLEKLKIIKNQASVFMACSKSVFSVGDGVPFSLAPMSVNEKINTILKDETDSAISALAILYNNLRGQFLNSDDMETIEPETTAEDSTDTVP